MIRAVFILLAFCGVAQGNVMQEFISSHVPMKENGKIDIPLNIKRVKLDIGLSYSAPMSQHWLSHEDDLLVFGFEPDLTSVSTIKKGAVKPLSLVRVLRSYLRALSTLMRLPVMVLPERAPIASPESIKRRLISLKSAFG